MGGDFVPSTIDHTLQLAGTGGQRKEALETAEQIFQITIKQDTDYPKVIGVLESVVPLGMARADKLRCVLREHRHMDSSVTLSWKLPPTVAIAAIRGNRCTTDEMKKAIGRQVRREFSKGVGEEAGQAMVLLGERIVHELLRRWLEVEEILNLHLKGDQLQFPEWKGYIDYVAEGAQKAVYVSPKWGSDKECAIYAFSSQLHSMALKQEISMKEARAHWLFRCGARFGLESRREQCDEIASDQQTWNETIGKLTSEIAKYTLWWKEEEDEGAEKSAAGAAEAPGEGGDGGGDHKPAGGRRGRSRSPPPGLGPGGMSWCASLMSKSGLDAQTKKKA